MKFSLSALINEKYVKQVDYFEDIVKLSYIGDIRTYVKAEKKDKVKNVVLGAFPKYLELYHPYITKFTRIKYDSFEIYQDKLSELYDNVPQDFIRRARLYSKYYINDKDFKELFINKMDNNQRRIIIEKYVKHLNHKYSTLMLFSAIYSTNPSKMVNID